MVDLESGETSDEDVEGGGSKMDKKRLGRLRSGSLNFNGPEEMSDDGSYSSDDEMKPIVLGKEEASTSGRVVKENGRPSLHGGKFKKHPKPPRHPRSTTSLDADSIRLVREIAQAAQQKRARIERMRALKSKKADSRASSSSTNNIIAMIVTLLFFCIIIFQGILGTRV